MKRILKKPIMCTLIASAPLFLAHSLCASEISSKDHVIKDSFETVEQIKEALREERLESSDLIIGIDFTGSNQTHGSKTFGNKNLHSISKGQRNPYQAVIEILSTTLAEFDDDGIYPAYIFGDRFTQQYRVKPLTNDMPEEGYDGFDALAAAYSKAATKAIKNSEFSGPTTFAPMIRKAIEITKSKQEDGKYPYHILLILTDGEINHDEPDNLKAIQEASKYPISIIAVGVGDGPWGTMDTFDDKVPNRDFDNFQFVNFHETVLSMDEISEEDEDAFATAALQEIPEQYRKIKELKKMDAPIETVKVANPYPKSDSFNYSQTSHVDHDKHKKSKKKKKKKFFKNWFK